MTSWSRTRGDVIGGGGGTPNVSKTEGSVVGGGGIKTGSRAGAHMVGGSDAIGAIMPGQGYHACHRSAGMYDMSLGSLS